MILSKISEEKSQFQDFHIEERENGNSLEAILRNRRKFNLNAAWTNEVNNFQCSDSEITSLSGGPSIVHGAYICSDNNTLPDLRGAPKFVKKTFSMSGNHNITSLKYGPRIVNGDYMCIDSGLNTLLYLPEHIGGRFILSGCPIEDSIIGLLKVTGIKRIIYDRAPYPHSQMAMNIVIKHYKPDGDGDVLACQKELMKAGFREFIRTTVGEQK